MKSEKLETDVYYKNSLNHCPQRRYDTKASIETTWDESVIVISQLLMAGSSIDGVTIVWDQQLFTILNNWAEWRNKMWMSVR